MRKFLIAALAWLAAAGGAFAQVPYFPQTLPPGTVIGRLPSGPGPTQAIPFSVFLTSMAQTPLTGPLTIDLNPAKLPTPPTGIVIQAGQNNGVPTLIDIDTFINSQPNIYPDFIGRNAEGTAALPTASLAGDVLVSLGGRGYNGTAYSAADMAFVEAVAAENWSGSANGTYFVWQTTAAGTLITSERMRLNDSGLNLGVIGTRAGVLNLNGATSGAASITAQAAAGTPVITLGTSSGTPAVTASAPLSLTTATGNIAITGAAGQILNGATPAFTATPVLGVNTSTAGTLGLANGGGSGATVTVQNPGATAAYNFNLPATAGSTGNLLASAAGGATAMTWTPGGQLPATATNDSANAGNLGELITSTLARASAASVTSGSAVNITSISLTAGDWDVSGNVGFTANGTTSYTVFAGWTSTTSATFPTAPNNGAEFFIPSPAFVPGNNNDMLHAVGSQRMSLTTTTTVWLSGSATFTLSTSGAYGVIRARRVR